MNTKYLQFLSIFSFLFLWEILSRILLNPLLIPPPSVVFKTLIIISIGNHPVYFLPIDFLYSLYHYVMGFGAAILLGIPLGMVIGWFRSADRFSYPLIELIRPIPPIAWIPVAIAILKLTHEAAAFIIFMGSFWPILLNTHFGVKSAERAWIDAALTLGVNSNRTMFRKVIFPASLPAIFTGIKVGSGVSWMCVVAAEMFGVSSYGMGYKLDFARGFSPDVVIAYMIAIGMVGFALDRIYRYVERRYLKWRGSQVGWQ